MSWYYVKNTADGESDPAGPFRRKRALWEARQHPDGEGVEARPLPTYGQWLLVALSVAVAFSLHYFFVMGG